MRTTVEIPDDLFRRAKSEAALRGKKIKDLVEEGLTLVIENQVWKSPAPKKNQRFETWWEGISES
jgi:hypothetical protein